MAPSRSTALSAIRVGRQLGQYIQKRRSNASRQKGLHSTAGGAPSENTFQHDVQPLYRRRRMPRRKRRAWGRSRKRFQSHLNSRLPVKNFVKTTSQLQTATLDQQSSFYSVCGGVNARVAIELNDDLKDIVTQSVNQAPGTEIPAVANKLFLRNMQLENIIRNVSPVLVFLDVYRIYARRDVTIEDFQDNQGLSQIAQDVTHVAVSGFDTQQPPPSWVGANIFRHGVTPFQNPRFCSYFKIASKTRYRLEPSQTIQLHLRRRVNKVFDYEKNRNLVYKAGFTTGYFFVFYGSPTDAAGPAGTVSQACSLRMVRNVTYSYKMVDTGQAFSSSAFQQVVVS